MNFHVTLLNLLKYVVFIVLQKAFDGLTFIQHTLKKKRKLQAISYLLMVLRILENS